MFFDQFNVANSISIQKLTKEIQDWSLNLIFIKKEIGTCAEACTTMVS